MQPAVIADAPGLWGLLGALIYAGPRLTACLFTRQTGEHRAWGCLLEFGLAMLIGAIAAEAFGPWVQEFLQRKGHHELRAICAMLGLLANPMAPRVIDALSGRVLKAMKGE